MSVTVTTDGVSVPEAYQDENKVVVRTPSNTMDVSGGFTMMVTEGIYPLVTPSDFIEDDGSLENPSLAPNQISFKTYGEEAEVFEVDIHT